MEKFDIEELLDNNEIIEISINGFSMYPLLRDKKDKVIIQKVTAYKVKRGDIVLYRRKNSILVLHRCFKHLKDKKELFFVGDNQKEIEGPLDYNQIKGIVVGIKRNNKQINMHGFIYILYSKIWLLLRIYRPFIAGIIHKFARY